MHDLTDALLTAIEDNNIRRTALGFTKGDTSAAGKQSGEKLTVHHAALAETALIPHKSGLWLEVDAKELVQPVRYRIHRYVL